MVTYVSAGSKAGGVELLARDRTWNIRDGAFEKISPDLRVRKKTPIGQARIAAEKRHLKTNLCQRVSRRSLDIAARQSEMQGSAATAQIQVRDVRSGLHAG